MGSRPKLEAETIGRLNKLCELGARPPVIQALLPSIPESLMRSHWEIINGEPSKKGRLPNVIDWYFSSYTIRLHSSYAAAVWRQLSSSGMHYVDAYIATYEIYCDTFDQHLLTFDRVWFLGRILNANMITTVVCSACDSYYIHDKNTLVDHKHCPACRTFAPKTNPRRRRPAVKKEPAAITLPSFGVSRPLGVPRPKL